MCFTDTRHTYANTNVQYMYYNKIKIVIQQLVPMSRVKYVNLPTIRNYIHIIRTHFIIVLFIKHIGGKQFMKPSKENMSKYLLNLFETITTRRQSRNNNIFIEQSNSGTDIKVL